jgi:prepilin-type N-terminal cleavage/methylation domain-containing protein
MLALQRRRASPGRRGFTIIELLVVMTIIAVLAAIAVPRFRVSPRMHVRIAAQQMVRDAELVRNRALSLKRVARVQFNIGGGNYVGYADDNNDGVISATTAESQHVRAFGMRTFANGVIFGRGSVPAGIPGEAGVGTVTFPSNRIDFDARGLPNPFGTKGTVYLTSSNDPGAVFAIQMSAAGGFRLWSYNTNGVWE